MRVLADTNIWIHHFRRKDETLSDLLSQQVIVCHPFVIGELACGNLQNRKLIIEYLAQLPRAKQANLKESLQMVSQRHFYGRGIGLVDATLLASTLITPGLKLWTKDKRLSKLAAEAGVGFDLASEL